jgi:hypothetical protein
MTRSPEREAEIREIREVVRRELATEFQRIDAHECGYDHGFCADPDADPETAAFVDAAIRIVMTAAADAVDVLDAYRPSEHRERTQQWLDGCSDGLTEAARDLRRVAAVVLAGGEPQ